MSSEKIITPSIAPNKTAMLEHLQFLFGDPREYRDGRIEIAYTPADSGSVNKAEWCDVSDLQAAADYAESINKQPGVNVYVGAAIRNPDTAPFGRSRLDDYYASSVIWCDLDDPGAAAAAKDIYKNLPPSFVVVTGRSPDLRAQVWWKLMHPEDNAAALKENLAFACAALNGDKAVVDPARVMRLAGSVAWPKKDGRVPELTEIKIPAKPTVMVMAEKFKSYFPGVAAPLLTQATSGGVDGKPRNPFTGNLEIQRLLEATRIEGQWHINMRDAVAAMIGQRWPDTAIRIAVAPYLRDNSLKYDMITPLINSGRSKFGKPNPELTLKYDPETGEIFETVTTKNYSAVDAKSPLFYIPARDIKYNQDNSSLIKDVLGQQELSVIYGESNCGKTFFMTDLAFHVARGIDWRGKRTTQGGVMYAALEGAKGLSSRFEAYCIKNGIDDRNFPFALMPCALDFYSEAANITQFIDLIKRSQDDIGDPKLITVDTLARALAGGDENSGQDMGRLVYYSDMIRRETAAHLSFVHHSGKNKALGARGHSSLRAAVDTEIEISREEGAEYSTIKFVKQREMEMIDDMAFSLERVVIGIDKFADEISSCVVVPAEIETEKKEKAQSAKERFVYEAIIEAVNLYGQLRAPYKDGPTLKTVTFDQLAEVLEEMGYDKMFNKEGETNVVRSTKSVRLSLRDKNLIGFNAGGVWLLDKS